MDHRHDEPLVAERRADADVGVRMQLERVLVKGRVHRRMRRQRSCARGDEIGREREADAPRRSYSAACRARCACTRVRSASNSVVTCGASRETAHHVLGHPAANRRMRHARARSAARDSQRLRGGARRCAAACARRRPLQRRRLCAVTLARPAAAMRPAQPLPFELAAGPRVLAQRRARRAAVSLQLPPARRCRHARRGARRPPPRPRRRAILHPREESGPAALPRSAASGSPRACRSRARESRR